jgi:hypothetical protein
MVSSLMVPNVLIQHGKLQEDRRHGKPIVDFVHARQSVGNNILGTPNKMMHQELKRGESNDPTTYSAYLTWVGKTPHESLIISFKVELHILHIWPEFLKTKQDSKARGEFPFLLRQGAGCINYRLAITIKVL